MSEKILNSAMTIENKVIDCTLMPDEKFQVLKNALDLANDPNRGCKMYFGTVLPEDMKQLTRFFGYRDMRTYLTGMGCGAGLLLGVYLIAKGCMELKEEKET